jgi:predicted  nucleic acid-binding Zn ribbon protein
MNRTIAFCTRLAKRVQACDLLQIHCGFGERFGLNQMSKLNSGLSKEGLEVCRTVQDLTNKPCYYYLHRYNDKVWKKKWKENVHRAAAIGF